MDRTSGNGFVTNSAGHRVFVDENLVAGINGSDVNGVWLTSVQEEILAVIEQGGGEAANPTVLTQLLTSIQTMITASRPPPPVIIQLSPNLQLWTAPAGVRFLEYRLVGAGGGGGASDGTNGGGGGGAGGYAEGNYPVSPGEQFSYAIGIGGASGQQGGFTAFAGASATGGMGGASGATFNPGGAGGVGNNFSPVNLLGGYGSDGQFSAQTFPGNGGASAFGGGGRAAASHGVLAAAQNGQAPGSGGGGAYSQAGPGGNGANGIIILKVYT